MVYYVTPQQKSFIPSLFPPPSFPQNAKGSCCLGSMCLGKLSQGELETVIVSVLMCYNEVLSGFPIATSVPLLARWPI